MSVVVSLLQSLGLLSRAIRRDEKTPNPFLELVEPPKEVRQVRLADLQSADQGQALDAQVDEAANKVGLRISLGDIYRIGKIEPPEHGVTIDSVAKQVYALRAVGKTDEAIVDEVTIELAASQVTLDALVEDAIKRDNLIDLFDEAATIRVGKKQHEVDAEVERLQAEMERIKTRIEEAQAVRARLAEELVTWRGRKSGIEQQWANALQLMIGKDVVSVTEVG